jgi:glyoxylase-like metal-dependent hydrolase (beta-lactamase superfamily II)
MNPHAPAIYKLPLPTPYPVGDINAYLIDGDEPVLVDTGVYSSKSIKVLEERLAEHGRRIKDIRYILITHHHYDHAGAVLHLSQLAGAKLYLHERSSVFTGWQPDTTERLIGFMTRCGVEKALMEKTFGLFRLGEKFADHASRPPSFEWLKGGETVRINGLELKAIHTPGHSPDHVCYMDAESGVLLSGDTLLARITPNPLIYLDNDGGKRTRSLLDYLDSLNRLHGFDISHCHPGHGPAIEQPGPLIDKNLAFIGRRKNVFLEKSSGGGVTPFELSVRVFGELDPVSRYLAVSETVAYLDLLERDGSVTVDWESEMITVVKKI